MFLLLLGIIIVMMPSVLALPTATTVATDDDDDIPECEDGYCPLSNKLIPLNSSQGYALLANGKPQAFYQLINNFESQMTPYVCGVGTAVTVLNSMAIQKPKSTTYCPIAEECSRYFTQQYLRNEFDCTKQVITRYPENYGLQLAQVAEIFNCFPTLRTEVIHSDNATYDELVAIFKKTYQQNVFVIANYLRTGVHQEGGGHFSPLGAYNEKEDRVLILDVSRFVYPPVWVKSSDLIAALNTTDPSNDQHRGLLVVYGPGYSSKISLLTSTGRTTLSNHFAPPILFVLCWLLISAMI